MKKLATLLGMGFAMGGGMLPEPKIKKVHSTKTGKSLSDYYKPPVPMTEENKVLYAKYRHLNFPAMKGEGVH